MNENYGEKCSHGGYLSEAERGSDNTRDYRRQGGYAVQYGGQVLVGPCANIYGEPVGLFEAMGFHIGETEVDLDDSADADDWIDYQISMLPNPCPLARECGYFDETNIECGQTHGSCYLFQAQKQPEKPSCPFKDYCTEHFKEGLGCREDYYQCVTYSKLADQAFEAIMINFGFGFSATPLAEDLMADLAINRGLKHKIFNSAQRAGRIESHCPKPPRIKGRNRGVLLPRIFARLLEEEWEAEDFHQLSRLNAPGLEEFLPGNNGRCKLMETCRRADPDSFVCRERYGECCMFEK